MLKKVFFVLLFISFSTFAHALPVGPITIPCDSGTLVITGDFTPVNGEFNLNLTATNCDETGQTINGTAAASGSFQLVTSSNGTLNSSFSYQFTVAGADVSGAQSCTGTLNGIYNLSTLTFQGSENRTCNSTGTIQIPFVDLLFGRHTQRDL